MIAQKRNIYAVKKVAFFGLSFLIFTDLIGFEMKRQLKIRQLWGNISTSAYEKRLKKSKNFDIILINEK